MTIFNKNKMFIGNSLMSIFYRIDNGGRTMGSLSDFKLQQLIRYVECENDYECQKNGLSKFSRVKPSKSLDLALCNSKNCSLCNYATKIGENKCCMCPVLNHLIKKNTDDTHYIS